MQVGPPAPPSPPPLAPAVTPRLLASSPRAHRPVLSRAPPPSSPQNGVELTSLVATVLVGVNEDDVIQ